MKKFVIIFAAVAFYTSCNNQYDNIEKYVSGINIYPTRYDTALVRVVPGFNRVVIDLMAERLETEQLQHMRAVRTIVEIYGEEQPRVFEGVRSWLNITGLLEPKTYRMTIYTEDEHGNKSLPINLEAIPYTQTDLDGIRVAEPRIYPTPASASLEWRRINNDAMSLWEVEYQYVDKNGDARTGTTKGSGTTDETRTVQIDMLTLTAEEVFSIDVTYHIIPKYRTVVNNVDVYSNIIDTVPFTQTFSLRTQSFDDYTKDFVNRKIEDMFWASDLEPQVHMEYRPTTSMVETVFIYKNGQTGEELTTKVVGADRMCKLPGLKLGDPIIVRSYYYNPVEDGDPLPSPNDDEVNTSDFFAQVPVTGYAQINEREVPPYEPFPNSLYFNRADWRIIYTPVSPETDGQTNINQDLRLPDNRRQDAIFDGYYDSFLSIQRPGRDNNNKFSCSTARPDRKTDTPYEVFAHFVVDLQEPLPFNFIRIVQRTRQSSGDNIEGTPNLWVWGLRLYGTNDYKGRVNDWNNYNSINVHCGTGDPPNGSWNTIRDSFYKDTQTAWEPILKSDGSDQHFLISQNTAQPLADRMRLMRMHPPSMDFTTETKTYRYLMVEYSHWRHDGNSNGALQIGEFYLGYTKNN